jgi:hypothetical protein
VVIRAQGEHACQLDFPEYFRGNYVIPREDLDFDPENGSFFVAAQAAVRQPVLDNDANPVLDDEGNPVYQLESAWGEGTPIPPGKNWAMYFSVSGSISPE